MCFLIDGTASLLKAQFVERWPALLCMATTTSATASCPQFSSTSYIQQDRIEISVGQLKDHCEDLINV